MADAFKTKTMGMKNKKKLALAPSTPKMPEPLAGDSGMLGGLGTNQAQVDTLEIGVEFQLDLKTDDLVILRELGAGNGGTVSKVMHPATKIIMARKVGHSNDELLIKTDSLRSYMLKLRRP